MSTINVFVVNDREYTPLYFGTYTDGLLSQGAISKKLGKSQEKVWVCPEHPLAMMTVYRAGGPLSHPAPRHLQRKCTVCHKSS